jgi:hypothetical protein
MQITLCEDEIKQAITGFVAAQGITITNKELEISLSSGRNPITYNASIDIRDISTANEGPGNQLMDNFKLPSTTDDEVAKDIDEVNKVIEEEAAKPKAKPGRPKATKQKEEPETTESELFEPEGEEEEPEQATEDPEPDDEVDSLFG